MKLGDLITPAKVERCGAREFPVLSMTMHDGIVLQADRFKKAIASKDQSTYKVVKPGQLVVGFPIDEGVLYIQGYDHEGIMSPAYNVWDVNTELVDARYLELALHSPQSMSFYREKMRGTTARRRSLPAATLVDLEIPVPNRSKQVDVVDALLGIRQGIAESMSFGEHLDELVKSRFVEMFGDASGEHLRLEDCCVKVMGGKTPSMKHPEYYGGSIPFIKSGDVKEDVVSSGALWLSDKAIENASVKLVPAGSVLVVVRSALLKRKVCMSICSCDVAINQDIRAFSPKPEFTSSYLLWSIRSHEQDLLNRVRSVNTSGMDMKQLYDLSICVTPIARQQEFETFVQQVDKLKFETQQAIEKLQMLYDSLAQEYFAVG